MSIKHASSVINILQLIHPVSIDQLLVDCHMQHWVGDRDREGDQPALKKASGVRPVSCRPSNTLEVSVGEVAAPSRCRLLFVTQSAERAGSVSLLSSGIVLIPDKWAFLLFLPLQLQCSLIISQFMEKNAMLLLLMEVACYLFMSPPSLGFIFPIKFGSSAQTPR